LADQKLNLSSTESLNNTTKFSNPIQITVDDAISDYTTIGIGVSYYSMHLTEQHIATQDTFSLDTKGFKAAIQLRGIRYFIQGRRFVCYMFAGAGLRFRSLTDAASDPKSVSTAYIHQIGETKTTGYSAFSFDAGLGLKFLLTRNIGISAETGVTTGIAQIGLFYSFKNKWRRPIDNIGW
jgi:uncharacterized membrane protein